MIEQLKQKFDIPEDEALYIREVSEEKIDDDVVVQTVEAHRRALFPNR